MLKLLILRFWPIFLPVLLYFAWMAFTRRKAAKAGEDKPAFKDGPWQLTVAVTLALAIGSFVVLGFTSQGSDTQGQYVPAKVVNGKIVPGHREAE